MARMDFKNARHAEIATTPARSLKAGVYAGKIISLACRIIGAKSAQPMERVFIRFVPDGQTQTYNFELPVFWASDSASNKQARHLALYHQIVSEIYQEEEDDPTDGMPDLGPNTYGTDDDGHGIYLSIGAHVLAAGGEPMTLSIAQKEATEWQVENGVADENGLVNDIAAFVA